MSAAHNSRNLLNERLDSAELAAIIERYSDKSMSEGEVRRLLVDLQRLWWEVDALRFELAAANERTRMAREERKNIEDRDWQLQCKLPGGKI